jgi:hypothetical protein
MVSSETGGSYMAKITNIKLVINRKRKADAKAVYTRLKTHIKDFSEVLGEDIGGFALIMWNKEGSTQVDLSADIGAIGPSMVPVFAHDALNRHVTVVMLEENEVLPGDSA